MFTQKKKYYLFIENTRDFNLNLIKIRNKINIIYRNKNTTDNIQDLLNFRKNCKKKGVNFFVANDKKLLSKLDADGLYISAHNVNLLLNIFSKSKYKIIGSAHNRKEVDIKIKQGCKTIIYSRLFETGYDYKKSYLGVIKFNIISHRLKQNLVPLGGINEKNLCKMNSVVSNSFACLSAIKKKPAKIINRLF
jgi:thiamine-phosphate pyrophosphorylase|tara:strand:+ start:42 stop:617 length:576 start_codon:yes stop_codon:yes gene_type:complete